MRDDKGIDAKILCVPADGSPLARAHPGPLDDVRPHLRNEIRHFFEAYKELEPEKSPGRGLGRLHRGRTTIEDARTRHGGT